MIIRLTDSRGSLFAQVASFEAANLAARAIWKRDKWSDIHYFIEFDDLQETHGSIDIEPHDFFARNQRQIITWHLKTFWGNIVKHGANLPYSISSEDISFFKFLLTKLPN
jgi:hypothetical protein